MSAAIQVQLYTAHRMIMRGNWLGVGYGCGQSWVRTVLSCYYNYSCWFGVVLPVWGVEAIWAPPPYFGAPGPKTLVAFSITVFVMAGHCHGSQLLWLSLLSKPCNDLPKGRLPNNKA